MMLFPLDNRTFNPEIMLPAAASLDRRAPQSFGTDGMGDLHRQIPTGQNLRFQRRSLYRCWLAAAAAEAFVASMESTALLSRT